MHKDSIESLDNVAITLLNLGVNHLNKSENEKYKYENEKSEKCFNDSLKIFEDFLIERPFYALQQIALIKNNLGNLYWKSGLINKAKKNFNQAVEINTSLVNINPYIAAPDGLFFLVNLALFYQQEVLDRNKSVTLSFNAIILGLPILGSMKNVDIGFNNARTILFRWGISDDEIEKWIDNTMEELTSELN